MRGRDAGRATPRSAARSTATAAVAWREEQRNRNPDGDYHARLAHARAAHNAHRPKVFRLNDAQLRDKIEAWMDDGWSPN